MKGKKRLLISGLIIFSTVLFSCKRKCASPDGMGTQFALGSYELIAPTAFTPNADGLNDTYRFHLINPQGNQSGQQITAEVVKNFRLEITRNGQLVFETYAWGNAWNGKNKLGQRIDGVVNAHYSISDIDGNAAEGDFNIFVVPNGCLEDCMINHIFEDMIDPVSGPINQTKETFCK